MDLSPAAVMRKNAFIVRAIKSKNMKKMLSTR